MSAATTNLIIDQGTTWEIIFTYKDSDGVAIPLNNYTAALQLRTSYDAPTAALSLTSAVNGGIVLGSNGTISVTATPTQTGATPENLPAGEYVYDLEITSPAPTSKVTRLVQGRITVTPQVTR